MAEEFTPITTQEALDAAVTAAIGDRYGDYETLKANEKKYAGYEKTLGDLTTENKKLRTAALKGKVAHELGLPYELADRLTGESEEDIRKDGEVLKKLMKRQIPGAPMFTTEPSDDKGASKNAALRAFAKKLTGND